MLSALVNNNVRCYNESMEFAERVENALDDDHKVSLHKVHSPISCLFFVNDVHDCNRAGQQQCQSGFKSIVCYNWTSKPVLWLASDIVGTL